MTDPDLEAIREQIAEWVVDGPETWPKATPEAIVRLAAIQQEVTIDEALLSKVIIDNDRLEGIPDHLCIGAARNLIDRMIGYGRTTTAADWLAADIEWLDDTFGPLVLPDTVTVTVRESAADGKLSLVLHAGYGHRQAVVQVVSAAGGIGDRPPFTVWPSVRDYRHGKGRAVTSFGGPQFDKPEPSVQAVADKLDAWVRTEE